jgi:predicted helicase
MRKSEGKQYGYIILPIGVPADVAPEEALDNHEKYKVVWQVLQALRAHDDRFNAIINKIELNSERTSQIQVIGVGAGDGHEDGDGGTATVVQTTMDFPHLEDWENAIFAKIVVKCGNRRYWEQWAKDVAGIAERHVTRIKALLEDADPKYRLKFERFLKGLRKTLNPSISADDAIEMLAQHMVTKPVFDALFANYEFTKLNPVSKTMQKMLDLLEEQSLDKETGTLTKFYESVKERVDGVDNAQGRQKIVVELYDKFFREAFPKMSERLGIVYTPIEIVDFIIRSADEALKSEFGMGLSDKDVHVLDPFTGTGTFIVRLLQSGIIKREDLRRKFREELHANELVLLAYYIAAINIEEAFHDQADGGYEPFDGILLTDTFQLTEGENYFDEESFQANSERAKKQNKRDIRVIIGNPPYSAGQESQNDNNQNMSYPRLDGRIDQTYARTSSAALRRSIYNSYIRAIRWATDRIKDDGIICFVTDGGFIDGNAMDGLRGALVDEFTSIHIFNLRGNQRTQGEESRREGGKVFGSGSRQPIAITLLIKNSSKKRDGVVHYHDIGDYLTREVKLAKVQEFASMSGLPLKKLIPNKNNDWVNQRDEAFEKFVPLGLKEERGESTSKSIFITYSLGISTNRDAWSYNFSAKKVVGNMTVMTNTYNEQVEHLKKVRSKATSKTQKLLDILNNDPAKIKWSSSLHRLCEKGVKIHLDKSAIREAQYRPFCAIQLCAQRQLIERPGKMFSFFPTPDAENRVIAISGVGATCEFSALMSRRPVDLELVSHCQSFPLFTHHEQEDGAQLDLIADTGRKSNITDFSLEKFRSSYSDSKISKEDIFYYIYGLLHSQEYRTRFASDLGKSLARVPLASDFWAFSIAGRKLADLHVNYEAAKPYPGIKQHSGELNLDASKLYQVEKMRFGKKGGEQDKTVIQYNSHITLSGIPLEAYEYVVNGKPAISWIMERYQMSKDKDNGILNNPNDWAKEQGDPEYILKLLKSIVTVSMETIKVVNSLPPLNEKTN